MAVDGSGKQQSQLIGVKPTESLKEKRKKSWPWSEEKEKSGHGVPILNGGERRVAKRKKSGERW